MINLPIKRMFIQSNQFANAWEDLGFGDNDLRRLELMLLKNPKIGDVVVGTGRLRKVRFAFPKRGKSGSVRVCYVDFEEKGICYLLAVFAKNEQENLTAAERNTLKVKIDTLDATLKGGILDERRI